MRAIFEPFIFKTAHGNVGYGIGIWENFGMVFDVWSVFRVFLGIKHLP